MSNSVGIGEVILVQETEEREIYDFNQYGSCVVSQTVVVPKQGTPPQPSHEGQLPGQVYFLFGEERSI